VLHGYLLAVCDGAGVAYQREDSMAALFKRLRSGHPQLADLGPRAQDVEKVLNSCASILDAMLPVSEPGERGAPERRVARGARGTVGDQRRADPPRLPRRQALLIPSAVAA